MNQVVSSPNLSTSEWSLANLHTPRDTFRALLMDPDPAVVARFFHAVIDGLVDISPKWAAHVLCQQRYFVYLRVQKASGIDLAKLPA
jgi:hypothetical protein